MKYKVLFNKFIYVEADNEEEALEKVSDGETIYEEEELTEIEEVDEFYVDF